MKILDQLTGEDSLYRVSEVKESIIVERKFIVNIVEDFMKS